MHVQQMLSRRITWAQGRVAAKNVLEMALPTPLAALQEAVGAGREDSQSSWPMQD
jgi:hypothetical protein